MNFRPVPLSGPAVLRIAADVRRAPTDYADDQIWEMEAGGSPPGLAATTTYARRAAAMRIFPSFSMGGPVVSDPAAFHRPPELQASLPSYLRLSLAPLPGLDVVLELRVADSQTLAGRLTLTNSTDRFRPIRLGLLAHLIPLPGGGPMIPGVFEGVGVLAGRSGGLEPVLFLTGGASAEPGRVPAMTVQAELAPGAARAFTWAEAAAATAADSFERARRAAGQAWDAEVARLEQIHASWVEVESGDVEWDSAFHLGQQSALAGFVGPAQMTGRPVLVLQRAPDRGYSVRGDGRDHDQGWDGPNALQAYFVVRQMAPAAPDLAAAVVRSFWSTQRPDGTIDALPGAAGQKTRLLCPPLLATLTLQIDTLLGDPGFLEEGFRTLWPFFRTWFSPPHDRDGDGWPEWDGWAQVPWPNLGSDSGEIEAASVEDPALLALLYREAESLQHMADRLGRQEASRELGDRRRQLRSLLPRAWSEERLTYLRLDRDAHRSPAGERLAQGTGSGKQHIGRSLSGPARLTVTVEAQADEAGSVRVRVRGRVASGRVRVATWKASDFRWDAGAGRLASELLFTQVESVEASGLPVTAGWRIEVASLAEEHLSGLLPLWAGMVEPSEAGRIVRRMLGPGGHLCPAGLAFRPGAADGGDGPPDPEVWLPLNLLLGEALLRYGFLEEADALLRRWMAGVIAGLKGSAAFHRTIACEGSSPQGDRHDLCGLPPLSMYLDLLGIGLESPGRVRLEARRGATRRGRVRWRGQEVWREGPTARVTFPTGETATTTVTEDVIVELAPEISE